jgi:hypothetical protein
MFPELKPPDHKCPKLARANGQCNERPIIAALMGGALTDAYSKVEWAERHIKVLMKAIDSGERAATRPLGPEDGPAFQHRHLLKTLPSDIPTDLALIAADAIHNMRSALDYLMAALALANGKSGGHPTFPICRNERLLMKRDALKSISLSAQAFIKSVQPYASGCHVLWWLHQLDVIDKHRRLSILQHGPPQLVLIPPANGEGPGDWYMLPTYWIEEETGAPRQSVVELLQEMRGCVIATLDRASAELFS